MNSFCQAVRIVIPPENYLLYYIPRKLAKYVWKCDEYWTSGFEVSGSLHVSPAKGRFWGSEQVSPSFDTKMFMENHEISY